MFLSLLPSPSPSSSSSWERQQLERLRRLRKRRRHLVAHLALGGVLKLRTSPPGIRTLYSDGFRGEQLTRQLLEPHNDTRLFRMTRFRGYQFERLLDQMAISEGREISSAQKLLIFLNIVSYGQSFREVMETFQHTGSTISYIFHEVLRLVVLKHRELVQPAEVSDTNEVRQKGGRYWPWFEGCVGPLDGSFVPAYVANEKDNAAYRNRKGWLSQNVLAVVNFKRLFTFVYPGWEGSAHDGRVFAAALDLKTPLLLPSDSSYYLGDAGYGNNRMVMVPYRGVRYHLKEVVVAAKRPRNAHELFNLRHSSLRNVVERTFGIMKNRFAIMKIVPQLPSWRVQCDIVYACTAIHNWLTITGSGEDEASFELRELEADETNNFTGSPAGATADIAEASLSEMATRRDRIAELMWQDYKRHLQETGREVEEYDCEGEDEGEL